VCMSGEGEVGGQQPPSLSAFRAVGGELVPSPAVKPATSPLTRSPEVSRRQGHQSSNSPHSPAHSSNTSYEDPEEETLAPTACVEAFPWPSQRTEESRQLLEGESSEPVTDTEHEGEQQEASSWVITREQLHYYCNQFKTMQPNPRGVIPGAQAKEFFEKSRLPVAELRQIWQLSDVTKDGCLSLEEFLTAMHLVVLRRNDIPLPEELPLCLVPRTLVSRHYTSLYPDTAEGQQPLLDLTEDSIDGSEEHEQGEDHSELTLSPESQLSSPGRPKPVKFNSTAVSQGDPSIICPKPLRLSPDSPVLRSTDSESEEVESHSQLSMKKGRGKGYEQLWGQDPSSNSETDSEGEEEGGYTEDDEVIEGLSASQSSGPLSLGAPPSVLGLPKKEGLPPCPPPRPVKSHARSASLDLNTLSGARSSGLALPSVPPRGAGEGSPFMRGVSEGSARDRGSSRDLHASIHSLRESVALLARTVAELGQEVADTQEERVVLEYQLEQLRSIGTREQEANHDSETGSSQA